MQLSLAQGREREVEDLNPLEVEVFRGVMSHDTTLLRPTHKLPRCMVTDRVNSPGSPRGPSSPQSHSARWPVWRVGWEVGGATGGGVGEDVARGGEGGGEEEEMDAGR